MLVMILVIDPKGKELYILMYLLLPVQSIFVWCVNMFHNVVLAGGIHLQDGL